MTDDENNNSQEPKPTIRKATTGAWWKSVSAPPKKKNSLGKQSPPPLAHIPPPTAQLSQKGEKELGQQETAPVSYNSEPDITESSSATSDLTTETKVEKTERVIVVNNEKSDSETMITEPTSTTPRIEAENSGNETKQPTVENNDISSSETITTEPTATTSTIETENSGNEATQSTVENNDIPSSDTITTEPTATTSTIETENSGNEATQSTVENNDIPSSETITTEPTAATSTIETENSGNEAKQPTVENNDISSSEPITTEPTAATPTIEVKNSGNEAKAPPADDNDISDLDVITTETELSVALEEKAKRTSPRKPGRSRQGRGRKEKRPETENNADAENEPNRPPEPTVSAKLLINAEEPEECRIALIEEGRLESYHVTTVSRERTKNNIYKGTIVSIEPNLQVAFVDIGTGRNGFLPFSEIHPEYFRQDVSEKNRQLVAQQQWKRLKIEDVVKKGQEVLVQVVKEVTGNKGANITTYLSLPGRFLVLMPGSDSAGISRKITGEERRSNLRQIMSAFSIPEGIGYIIRTASVDITKTGLQKDLRFLLAQWENIKNKGQTKNSPALIYEDEDTVTRFLRDHFTPGINEITVDTDQSYERVTNFVKLLPTKQKDVKVKMHRGAKPIFNQLNIEEQIESIFKPQVALPSGGSIVIDPTEALVAIDVNSGRTSKNSDFEDTIFLANTEAATELARQLRLRDLGGLIVVDFIDMRNKKHIREVEKQVRISMKRDKAKVDTSKISRFGLMQISRQKMGAPVEKASYKTCLHCQGRGVVRSVETQALYYLRRIQTGISRKKIDKVECRLPLEVAQYLLNKKRNELAELELKHDALIDILPIADMRPNDNQIDFLKNQQNNGNGN